MNTTFTEFNLKINTAKTKTFYREIKDMANNRET